jgi:hypothetical protein
LYKNDDFLDVVEECWVIAKTRDKEFSPTCNVIGGLMAQQAMKATGMQTPLSTQFLFFSALDLLGSLKKSREREKESKRENKTKEKKQGKENEKVSENEEHVLSTIEGYKEVMDKLKKMKVLPLRRTDQNLEALKCLVLLGACERDAGGEILLPRNPNSHLGTMSMEHG